RVSSYPANPRHFLFHSDALLHGRCWSSSHSADLLAWCYSFVPGVRAHGTQLRMSPRKTRGTWGFQQLPPACAEDEYRAWLVSELPVHAATKYREYLDNSAWMANLWIGWSLEFFVELFAHLHKGQDTKAGVDLAYKQTLSKHHNIRVLQRTAFSAAVKKLPSPGHLLERLRGDGASAEDVSRDLAAFVALGHAIARCCSQVNEDLKALQVREREALRVR
ncbi:unnamed protein product, partial [Prorocentrum cordatum]